MTDTQNNNELKIEKSWQDQCDECGDKDDEIYFVPSWLAHRCYGCLMTEARKFNYKVEKI